MLILTRRNGESIIVGDEIEVCVLSIQGQQVRIGINAPKDITVHRQEIYDRIIAQKNQIQTAENMAVNEDNSDLED